MFEFLRSERRKTIESSDISRLVAEMSDNINENEMKIILDQTFSAFGLIPGDSITEEICITVLRIIVSSQLFL